MTKKPRIYNATDKEKLLHYIDKNGPKQKHMKTCCWKWTGCVSSHGYGSCKFQCGEVCSHRAAFVVFKGMDIPKNMQVLHHCDYKRCCRPSHLYAGTPLQNVKDSYARGRMPKGDNHWTRKEPEKVSKIRKKAWDENKEHILNTRKNGMAKLDHKKVREIRRLYFDVGGWTQQKLADKFGMSIGPINDLLKGRTWSQVK